MNPDARRSERHRLKVMVPVVDTIAHRALGVTRDLSAGGMQLAAAAPLVDEALYQVEMELEGPGGGVSIDAGVQVLNQRLEGSQVLVGMRFLHLSPANARILSEWLAARGA